jgi:AcrR family transcriptional regulator
LLVGAETPTAERILRAAIAEFAEHGESGARVARIADTAEANRERLYHYFGDKEALFVAAVGEAMREIAEAEPFAADDLGAYVTAMIEFHRRNPDLVRLLLAEARHPASAGRPADAGRRAHYDTRVEGIRAAQADGRVRADLDPRIVVYAVLALVACAPALPQLSRAILAAGPGEPMSDERFAEQLAALVAALVAPR